MEQNKTGRYLKYAIGEIILVVIGILIALQVNTWNENRKFKNNEKELLENMLFNLKSDSINGYRMLEITKEIDSLHQKLYQIGINGSNHIQIKNPNDIRRMAIFQPITKKNDPFIVDKIKNKRIRSEVVSYFLALDQTDKYIAQLQTIMIDGMRAYLRKQNQHNLSALFESKNNLLIEDGKFIDFISDENLIELSKETEFQQLLFEVNLKSTEYSRTLDETMLQNKKLKKTILEELKSNY